MQRPRFVDISGKTYSRLTVISKSEIKNRNGVVWNCICECGKETTAIKSKLESGHKKSCGCLIEEGRHNRGKHWGGGTGEYRAWCAMKGRCLTPTNKRYRYYGGRGIKVCDRWINDFSAFLSDVGKKPSPDHSIDRIDVNGHYEPSNVRWADRLMQARNRRSVKVFSFNGKRMTLPEWAIELGVPKSRLRERILRGWSIEDALTIGKIKPTGIRR